MRHTTQTILILYAICTEKLKQKASGGTNKRQIQNETSLQNNKKMKWMYVDGETAKTPIQNSVILFKKQNEVEKCCLKTKEKAGTNFLFYSSFPQMFTLRVHKTTGLELAAYIEFYS